MQAEGNKISFKKLLRMELNRAKIYQRHYEESVLISKSAEEIFAYLDDHNNLSSHMNDSSWMMAGSRMETSIDAGHGRNVGSHIKMSGKIFGINLFLDEIITQREPPRIKVWETVGDVRLLIIGHYRMKVEIKPEENRSLFVVSIEYNLPDRNVWLGWLFGGFYAKWCVKQMIKGVSEYFSQKSNSS